MVNPLRYFSFQLFLIPAGLTKAVVCVILSMGLKEMSMGWCI